MLQRFQRKSDVTLARFFSTLKQIPPNLKVMKSFLTGLITLFVPTSLAVPLLNILGHKIHPQAKIGFSFLASQHLYLDKNSRIGHLNIIRVRKLLLREGAFIRSRNRIRGPINILMRQDAAIARDNSIYRGAPPICLGVATLRLDELGQIISKHHLDCTKSISIGKHSTVGGLGTQFWTHGFMHAPEGRKRIRVEGEIIIGDNVYVGSRCVFNPGLKVADSISIGSNSCIAKSLDRPGMYVSQPLRYLERNINDVEAKLEKQVQYTLETTVYEKAIS